MGYIWKWWMNEYINEMNGSFVERISKTPKDKINVKQWIEGNQIKISF